MSGRPAAIPRFAAGARDQLTGYASQCIYAGVDGRKHLTQSYVTGLKDTIGTLEDRVALLEALLVSAGVAVPEPSTPPTDIPVAPIASSSKLSAIDMPIQRTRPRAGDDEGEQIDEESAWVGEMDRLQAS